jgi:hypothetical protein
MPAAVFTVRDHPSWTARAPSTDGFDYDFVDHRAPTYNFVHLLSKVSLAVSESARRDGCHAAEYTSKMRHQIRKLSDHSLQG